MKKILILIVTLFVLTGCTSRNSAQKEKMDRYESYWTLIQDQESYSSSSEYFNIEVGASKGEYFIIVDKARVAMMNVVILAIENEGVYQTEKMMPSAGVFEDAIDLIPNQSKPDSDFKSGIKVGGNAELPLQLNVLVSWKSLSNNEEYREFFEFNITEDTVEEEPVTQEDTN